MKRFSFLIPRIIILMLLCTALWLGKDSLLRRAAMHYGQQFTNAKVEISHLQTDLKNNRVLLKNVKVADPRNPMSNLIQADLAYLKLDPNQLWSRKLKVTEGQVHGLVVNAPRTETGALTLGSSVESLAVSSYPSDELEKVRGENQNRLEEVSMRWLNKVDTSATPILSQSNVEELAQETESRWQARLDQYHQRAAELEPKLTALSSSMNNSDFANPLRDRNRFEKSLVELTAMQKHAAELRQALSASLEQLDTEMNEFDKVTQSDRKKLQQLRSSNQFDEDLISELLLSQEGNELVADVIAWLSWFRNSIPSPDSIDSKLTARGQDLSVENSQSPPDFLIEKLELEGNGWFARQHLNFIGTAYNLSSAPQSLREPTRIDLRALGKGNVLINCVVDRRDGKNCDHLSIQFPELEFSNKQVGHEKCMLVTFGDRRLANADIMLEINGTEIMGTVTLRYSQASLHVDSLSDLIGGDDTRLRINQGLSQLNQFKVEMAISGTLEDYSVLLNSDLGTQFAKVVDSAVIDRVAKQNQRLLQSIEQRSNKTTARVREDIRSKLLGLSEKLGQETVRIAKLKDGLENIHDSGWSKLR